MNKTTENPLSTKEQDDLERCQQILKDVVKLPSKIRKPVLEQLPGLVTFLVGQNVLSEISDIAEQLFKLPKRAM